MHVVLREFDRGAEAQQKDEDLPPALSRHEARKIQRQGAMTYQVADFVAELEFRWNFGGRNQADYDGCDHQQHAQRPPHTREIHGVGVPMTSAPGGGVNFTSDSATDGLRSLLEKSS